MVRALYGAGLKPQRITGSSAGALVGASLASGVTPDEIRSEFRILRREDFWDPGVGPGVLRGRRFRRRLADLLVDSFEDCALPVAVSTFDVLRRQTVVQEHGSLSRAVQASCAVPGMFHPVWIRGRPHLDGGILDRRALAGIGAGERTLLHLLVSKSPWRSSDSPGLRAPTMANLKTLTLQSLPRSGPFRLHEGIRAMDQAYERTARALDLPATADTLAVAEKVTISDSSVLAG